MSIAALSPPPASRSYFPQERMKDSARPEISREKDEALGSAAQEALKNTGYAAIGELHCEAIDGLVLLAGELPSFYLKQIAQEAVLRAPGALSVRNLVSVNYQGDE
jgi:hypothetical protein